MNNIKTIEVVKPVFGLGVGSQLTRANDTLPFEFKSETISDGFTSTKSVSISEESVNRDSFKAIEWFAEKPLTNKQKICSLIEELAQGQSRYNELVKENEELISILSKIDKRIQYKRDEFAKKVQELDKELADKLLCGERVEWADEALTVYANMLELLDKIVE